MADIDDAKELVLWARKNRVTLAMVKVGSVELAIVGMIDATPLPTEAEAARGLVAQYGGEALARAQAEIEGDELAEDED